MAGADIPGDTVAAAQASVPFVVQHQDVALDFDFTTQTITGRATLTIEPRTKDLREIRLSARQLEVTAIRIDNKHKVDGFRYADPYNSVVPLERYSVLQHHLFARRSLDPRGAGISTAELVVPLPQGFRVQQMSGIILSVRADSRPAAAAVDLDEDNAQKFRSFTLTIEYVVRSHREGVHWVGFDGGDLRYPHVYSYADSLARTPACSWFPCVEAAGLRHTWRLSVKCPRTLGDVEYLATKAREAAGEPVAKAVNGKHVVPGFSDEEKEMDLVVACSGFLEDNDAPDDDMAHSRKWVFNCQTPVLSRHVGFAIGPFEEVDLSEFRDRDQDDKMGQSAVSISGLCLPGRSDEVRNTCMPVASVSQSPGQAVANLAGVG
jgi:transcription initiation factor TFIID subunit 2